MVSETCDGSIAEGTIHDHIWLQELAPATLGQGPYTTICSFRVLRQQHRGRDGTRPYVASETTQRKGPYTTVYGFRNPAPVALEKRPEAYVHNRPYMLIFVQSAARRGSKIWGGVGRGKKQGNHPPRAPMCVDRYHRIMGLLKPIDTKI